ncbi:MAG: HlyC/CorC family transporter [Planctomycetia bacterium]|nr:HlyC/CorC family transporter [Planctomycetia bacterium]
MGVTELAIILAMIAINSVFAAYEIALASVTLARLRLLVGEQRPGAAAALAMKENMEASLAVVQVGITLVGAIAAATGGAGAEEDIAPWLQARLGLSSTISELAAIVLVVLPLTGVTIMFGELVPKVFALRHQEWVCLKLSPAMRWFGYSVWPAVWVFENGVTAIMSWGERTGPTGPESRSEAAELQELRASATLARASRLIGHREEGIILSAARLSSRPVREIVLPAEHISMLGLHDTIGDGLIAAHLDMHTRFPVAERKGEPQSIIGYVNFKDLVAALRLSPGEASVRAILRPLPSLAADQPIAASLEQLIRERSHIALVRDTAGTVLGMITLEDILEELVGDIQDEYDRLPAQVSRTGIGWVAGGGVALDRLRDATGLDLNQDLPPGGARNLSEWVTGHLGHPPQGGEVLERASCRLVVRKIRRQQLLEAQVSRPAAAPSPV